MPLVIDAQFLRFLRELPVIIATNADPEAIFALARRHQLSFTTPPISN